MFFNSFLFVGFFLIVLVLLLIEHRVSHNTTLRNATLLVASYFFYGYFNIGFTAILLFVTLVNFVIGSLMITRTVIRFRKIFVAIAVVLSLLPLAFFKYALFFIKSFAVLFSSNFDLKWFNNIIIPVGISFFTFQALSYTIDAYRGKIVVKSTFLDFALFVAFFPIILSGPIEKARNFLPQIQKYFSPTFNSLLQGCCIFVWGLFKKMVIADRLANYVDWAYDSVQFESGATLAVAAIFYSIQIYCDFSGYSDMALGVAKALGFDVTKNFKQPYFSKTFKDFWHKWHISLTSWFTEYVYFSLGGNRVKHKGRWIFNISTIFLLSGIWHGAAWNFLIWGGLHALYYLIEHFLGLQKKELNWNKLASVVNGIIIFILVTIAWIFFRQPTFDGAIVVLDKIFTNWSGTFSMGASTFTFVATIFVLLVFLCYELLIRKNCIFFDINNYDTFLARNVISIIPMIILIAMFGVTSDNFVYFQF